MARSPLLACVVRGTDFRSIQTPTAGMEGSSGIPVYGLLTFTKLSVSVAARFSRASQSALQVSQNSSRYAGASAWHRAISSSPAAANYARLPCLSGLLTISSDGGDKVLNRFPQFSVGANLEKRREYSKCCDCQSQKGINGLHMSTPIVRSNVRPAASPISVPKVAESGARDCPHAGFRERLCQRTTRVNACIPCYTSTPAIEIIA